MAGISLSELLHTRPAVVPTIYGYVACNVPDHEGYIKIGYTDRKDYEQRIREQVHTVGVHHKIVLVESAMRQDGTCFNDKDVHRILERRRFKRLNKGSQVPAQTSAGEPAETCSPYPGVYVSDGLPRADHQGRHHPD